MWRNITRHYYPHALLLASAATCLMLTPSVPDAPSSSHRQTLPDQPRVDMPVGDVAIYEYKDYVDTRGLAEVLERARIRSQRAKRMQPDEQERTETPEKQASLIRAEAPRQRTVRQQDIVVLPVVADQFSQPQTGFVAGPDPLLSQVPDVLPQREYDVLAFGEVGDAEPATTSVKTTRSETTKATANVSAFVDTTKTEVGLTDNVAVMMPAHDVAVVAPSIDIATSTAQASRTAIAQSSEAVQQPVTASQSIRTVAQTAEVLPVSAKAVEVSLAQKEQTVPTMITTAKIEETVKTTDRRDSYNHTAPEVETKIAGADIKAAEKALDKNLIVQTLPAPTKADKVETKIVTQTHVKQTLPVVTTKALPKTTVTTIDSKKSQTQSLVVLVDESETLGSDRLNAINSAMEQINQVAKQAEIDIELTVTTDKGAGHNILLREDDNKTLNGKLGLAQSASITDDLGNEQRLGQDVGDLGGKAVASINSDIDWYTGNDSSAIGKNQYDYQTAITHELLHLLGLDDDFGDDDDLVMHGYLSQGETRRAIAAAEQHELASRYSRGNLWGSVSNAYSKYTSNSRKGIRYRFEALTAAPVPEPAGVMLIGAGVCGLWLKRRRG